MLGDVDGVLPGAVLVVVDERPDREALARAVHLDRVAVGRHLMSMLENFLELVIWN